jgi:hypothetical protein
VSARRGINGGDNPCACQDERQRRDERMIEEGIEGEDAYMRSTGIPRAPAGVIGVLLRSSCTVSTMLTGA